MLISLLVGSPLQRRRQLRPALQLQLPPPQAIVQQRLPAIAVVSAQQPVLRCLVHYLRPLPKAQPQRQVRYRQRPVLHSRQRRVRHTQVPPVQQRQAPIRVLYPVPRRVHCQQPPRLQCRVRYQVPPQQPRQALYQQQPPVAILQVYRLQ